MNCREVQKILTEEIRLAESTEVRKHLEGCQACRDLQRDLLRLDALSGELKGQTKAPAFFTERVCSRVSGRSRAAYWSVAATAAGLVLFAIGVMNIEGLSTGSKGDLGSRAMNGGERIQRTEHDERAPAVSHEAQSDAFFLGGEEWGRNQKTGRSTFRSRDGVPLVMPEPSSSGYVLELPATIEVRQTQADNEFYLENVSH
ncbi:MAG: hypothetical protein EHM18_06980 [Acidobacteria bacterium]|nr:MAG: hypothetical protein EHM18_06980 [Acidobacteriota bacterium]